MSFRQELQTRLRELEIVTGFDVHRGAKTDKLLEDYNALIKDLNEEDKAKLTFDADKPFELPEEPPKPEPRKRSKPAAKKKEKSKAIATPKKPKAPKTKKCGFCGGTMHLNHKSSMYECSNCPHKHHVDR